MHSNVYRLLRYVQGSAIRSAQLALLYVEVCMQEYTCSTYQTWVNGPGIEHSAIRFDTEDTWEEEHMEVEGEGDKEV